MSEKIDLYKLHKDEYVAPKKPTLVKTRKAQYLSVDGGGRGGDEGFQEDLAALYAVAYTLKMTSKKEGRDYGVSKLEGLWDAQDAKHDWTQGPPELWNWTLMIRTPDFIGKRALAAGLATLEAKGKKPTRTVELRSLSEGKCVQILHVGPYDAEAPTIAKLQEFMAAEGLSPNGLHHEIYLSDPRRVEPERLRTILRHPVK